MPILLRNIKFILNKGLHYVVGRQIKLHSQNQRLTQNNLKELR